MEERAWSSQSHSLSTRPLHQSEALSRHVCIPGKWSPGHPTLCAQGSRPGPGSGCLCTGKDRHCVDVLPALLDDVTLTVRSTELYSAE